MPSGLPPGDTIPQPAQRWRKAGVCADRVHVLRLLVRAIAGWAPRPWMALATVGPARRAWKAREGGRAPMGPCGARGAPCTGPWRGRPLQEESGTPAVLILGRAERQNRPAAALCHRSGTPRGERTERLGLARQGTTTVWGLPTRTAAPIRALPLQLLCPAWMRGPPNVPRGFPSKCYFGFG